jgi:hypothetical protein
MDLAAVPKRRAIRPRSFRLISMTTSAWGFECEPPTYIAPTAEYYGTSQGFRAQNAICVGFVMRPNKFEQNSPAFPEQATPAVNPNGSGNGSGNGTPGLAPDPASLQSGAHLPQILAMPSAGSEQS